MTRTFSTSELMTAAKTLWGEARGEAPMAIAAVAHVILNRWRNPSWWGSTLHEVCRSPWQFSCWNGNDPNRAKLDELPPDDKDFLKCLAILCRCLAGDIPDPTRGATHYHTNRVLPAWAKGKEPTVRWGAHLFYALGPKG